MKLLAVSFYLNFVPNILIIKEPFIVSLLFTLYFIVKCKRIVNKNRVNANEDLKTFPRRTDRLRHIVFLISLILAMIRIRCQHEKET